MRIGFRFRAIPFVATVLLVALGIALGRWQDGRAAEKIGLQQAITARAGAAPVVLGAAALTPAQVELRPVTATGTFVRDWPLFLNNRPQEGKAGFYLLMPLRIEGTDMHVLVARGWLPRYTGQYDRLPQFDTPAGTVTITGLARAGMGKVMQLGTAAPVAPKAILQNLTPAEFAQASKLAVQPFFIEQSGPAPAGDKLVRNWPAPSLNVEKHQGYAFQWYALAVMALLFFVITGFQRGTKQND
ncbi:SURF1 family protein [Massilia pseudoviolaceinigra]|uniref:SURF1 family protein n=1 Tax=Massilia pseudoviolaceinigra TaxID=3057165 RepID=UPI0027967354|nr:SURF1 family protein [Massilia sp. CCM 9206]MDQ1922876.1 SURF1 family protein [Massilia sp. CCM 9206]